MSTIETRTQNGTGNERITDLRQLRRGDRVVFGDRTRPVDVVDLGDRTMVDNRIDEEIETPVVRVRGNWNGAVDAFLAHKIDRYNDGGIALEELDAIVACEDENLERGESVTVQRVGRSNEVSA